MSVSETLLKKRLADLDKTVAKLREAGARLSTLPQSANRNHLLQLNADSVKMMHHSRLAVLTELERRRG